MTRHARRFRRIARHLTSAELRGSSMDALFDERDLSPGPSDEPRFLDFYGEDGLRLALERYGFAREARARGYVDLDIETRCDDERHTLLVFGRSEDGARHRVAEAVVRRDRLCPEPVPGLPPLGPVYDVLTVDWLSLRNPLARFTPERPRLPGQDAPGLGLGEEVFELLCRAVERLRLEALVSTAQHFHNAVLYLAPMPFLDPRCAGPVHALMQTLMLQEGLSLAQASWAIHWGMVHELDADQPLRWRGEIQLWPRAPALDRHVHADAYFQLVTAAAKERHFQLDRTAFEDRWETEQGQILGGSPQE
jgi:hypothetical protein